MKSSKKTTIVTDLNGKILATAEIVESTQKNSIVTIEKKEGQQIHIVDMPEEYHTNKLSSEKSKWLEKYAVIDGQLSKK